MAVCGDYVCHYHGNPDVYIGAIVTYSTWCNNEVECYNGGVDEMYCREEEQVFGCMDNGNVYNISASKVCNRKCDCGFCDDEWQCGGYNYHYWCTCSNTDRIMSSDYFCDSSKYCPNGDDESNCKNVTICIRERFSSYTYLLANYSRCTPWVHCANKLDHTNCSDTTVAPLQCHVGGYISTVSQCKTKVCTSYNEIHSNTTAVCDDGIDIQCVHTSPWLLHTQAPAL